MLNFHPKFAISSYLRYDVSSMGETFTELFGGLWEVWKEMATAFFGFIPTALHFLLWILSGIIILPCVFIAGNLYPKWIEWGEDF